MSELVESVTVGQTLRPIRIAFLVDPADVAGVRRAIAWSTTLWGGQFCPLVPVWRRRPPWWGELEGAPRPSPEGIVHGYLSTYDPDWIVSLVEGYEPPVMQDRMATLGPWGIRSTRRVTRALPLEELLDHLYETRYRYLERHPPEIVFHAAEDASPLADVLLGRLRDAPPAEQTRAQLRTRFGAQQVDLSPRLLVRSQRNLPGTPPIVTPLDMGTEGVMFRHHAKQWTYVYFCSLRRAWDAIELWNLRAAGLDVFAVPLEWARDLTEPLDEVLQGPEVLPLGARALTARQAERARALAATHRLPLVLPPVFWSIDPPDHALPSEVLIHSTVVECPVREDRFDIPSLDPAWVKGIWPGRPGGWLNEYELHADHQLREPAAALPHDLEGPEPLVETEWLSNRVRLHRGRIVVPIEHADESIGVRLPTGWSVFSSWTDQRGLTSRLSDPGRVLLEIARHMDGLLWLPISLGRATVEVLNKGTRVDHLHGQQVASALREDGRTPEMLGTLTANDVLRAGLIVDCPRCQKNNWIPPEDLGQSLRCERCQEDFPFPHARPPRNWAYRPVGPFAVPGYANGAVPAALALATLTGDSLSDSTWVPSMMIERVGEIDFALWRQPRRHLGHRGRPELLLGEAKSHDLFEAEDVERLLRVREALGEGGLVFATLRDELTTPERRRLRAAVRELPKSDDGIAPLIVLTRHELFSVDLDHALRDAAGTAGGDPRALFDPSVDDISRVTQRAYLSLRPTTRAAGR